MSANSKMLDNVIHIRTFNINLHVDDVTMEMEIFRRMNVCVYKIRFKIVTVLKFFMGVVLFANLCVK